jgi:hypothetical protein
VAAKVRSTVLLYVPLVAEGKPVNGTATMTLPGPKGVARQQWMCAADAGADNPLKVTSIFKIFRAGSIITSAKPVPGDALGGTSFKPDKVVWKNKGVAWAIWALATITVAASAIQIVFMRNVLVIDRGTPNPNDSG